MEFVEIGIKAAREVGEMLKKRIGTKFFIEEKGSAVDLVTEMDQLAENLIREKILEVFPDHQVHGEESIYQSHENKETFIEKMNTDPYVWVVDPIDGTTNYVHQLPNYTISIALICYGEIRVGIIYNPSNDEMFWAEKGKGAFLNGVCIKVASGTELAECVLSTGFPSELKHNRSEVLKGIQELGLHCRNIRVFGSAALHCAYVAAGRLHAFWEPGLNVWDIAAGTLLVEEAGGIVSQLDGSPFDLSFKHYLCSNGGVHQEMLNRLRKVRV
ncbi:inositol monophosphatase family protein [Bacillus sp. REN16]|uniref:inositol monophosphatase family protein n=1 Tax=Bacillus sp. REN16 TaxID=2887296 RepID=UPI001E5E8224|nr:inositol monophosphatase family protein [Bacillus sp. REN16]MCC3356859.1 inositol monophosphatase [Bacillus sp. REN16]